MHMVETFATLEWHYFLAKPADQAAFRQIDLNQNILGTQFLNSMGHFDGSFWVILKRPQLNPSSLKYFNGIA